MRPSSQVKTFCLAILTIIITITTPIYAQSQQGYPAPSNVRDSKYPYINSDFRVTFTLKAPLAKKVQVVGLGDSNGLSEKPIDLVRDKNGLWRVTTPPARPGFHYYQFIIDGVQVNDPGSETYFGWGKPTSGLEVPDPKLDFYHAKQVPHGEVRVRYYRSTVTGELRQTYIYTPPDYDENIKRRYPVLYLQHGAGESERAWTQQGKANFILDNLIFAGKAKPMIIVMDNGYARKPGVSLPPDSWGNEAFPEVVLKDLIPLIDRNYRTIPNREYRAIAGLSMGGGQALEIGIKNLDTFAWVGGFSSLLKDFDINKSYGGFFQNAVEANRKLRLLWLACDTQDNLFAANQKAHQELAKARIEHVWLTGSGAHEWQVWRKYLYNFVPKLFEYNRSAVGWLR